MGKMKKYYAYDAKLCCYFFTFPKRLVLCICFSGCCMILTFPKMRSMVLLHNEELSSFTQLFYLNL